MRIVVDTNVLASAALKSQSTPGDAVELVAARHRLLKSQDTERELLGVLARPYIAAIAPAVSRERVRILLLDAELIRIEHSLAVCRDPSDDKFLELAIDGSADVIVSGNADLLVLHPFRGIPILSPAGYIRAALAG